MIFHLAAYNHVGGSFRHYSEALECNGNGTANLLNAYQEYDRFVYISVAKLQRANGSLHRDKNPQPVSPYAIGNTPEAHCRMMAGLGAHHGITTLVGPISTRAVVAEIIACLNNAPVRRHKGLNARIQLRGQSGRWHDSRRAAIGEIQYRRGGRDCHSRSPPP